MLRTMHILDDISSVSRSSKCTKIVGGRGFAPDPTGGAHSVPQTFQLGSKGSTSKAPTSKGRGEEKKEGEGRGAKIVLYYICIVYSSTMFVW